MSVVLKRASQLPFAPVIALMFGGVAAVLVLATPVWMLEQGVVGSGLPTLFGAAEPPLGLTAQVLLSVLAALAVGAAGFLSMIPISKLLSRPRRGAFEVKPMRFRPPDTEQESEWPVAGFARPPIFADRDLGAPFMSNEALVAAPVEKEEVAVGEELVLDELYEEIEPDSYEEPVFEVEPLAPSWAHIGAAPVPIPEVSLAEPPESTWNETIAPTTTHPEVKEAAPGAESISSLVLRLERGIDQRSIPSSADPFSADAALGALDRLAAGSR